ncbi:unnamed protein product, partial [Cyprideis torosa]
MDLDMKGFPTTVIPCQSKCQGLCGRAPRRLAAAILYHSGEAAPQVSFTEITSSRPDIRKLHVDTLIRHRYAISKVTSHVVNPSSSAQEVQFKVTLPEEAFISNFSMLIRGKEYVAYVKGREAAKAEYDQAVSQGQSAGHVALNPRESSRFTVSVNLAAEEKVVFTLTYEELLRRRLGNYEYVINIDPGQGVKDMRIRIEIQEQPEISDIRVPDIRNSVEFVENERANPLATIERPTPNSAIITYAPTIAEQLKSSNIGVQGQFALQYDVAREMNGELLTKDGYFVYFMAPPIENPLPKHVVFALDTSGSMRGRKNEQLIEAIKDIVDDLFLVDYFSFIDFDDEIHPWKPEVGPIPVNDDTIKEAKDFLDTLDAFGGTDVEEALRQALDTAKKTVEGVAPMIVILTDGESYGRKEVLDRVNAENRELKIPIFSLAFGDDADFDYLKKISLKNQGFARKIYAASDAVTQLRNFYREISSPLLESVNVTYGTVESTVSPRQKFLFQGQELVTAGKLLYFDGTSALAVTVEGKAQSGRLVFEPTVTQVSGESKTNYMERLFAFLSIKSFLEQRAITDDPFKRQELESKVSMLALKYGFVTELTSLVVVKPDKEELGNIELREKKEENEDRFYQFSSRIAQSGQAAPAQANSIDLRSSFAPAPELQSHTAPAFLLGGSPNSPDPHDAHDSPFSTRISGGSPNSPDPHDAHDSPFSTRISGGSPNSPDPHDAHDSPFSTRISGGSPNSPDPHDAHDSPFSTRISGSSPNSPDPDDAHDSPFSTRISGGSPNSPDPDDAHDSPLSTRISGGSRMSAIDNLRQRVKRTNNPFLAFVETNNFWHLLSDLQLQDLSKYDPSTDTSDLGQDSCPLSTQTCQPVLRHCDSVTADRFTKYFLHFSTSSLRCGPPEGLLMANEQRARNHFSRLTLIIAKDSKSLERKFRKIKIVYVVVLGMGDTSPPPQALREGEVISGRVGSSVVTIQREDLPPREAPVKLILRNKPQPKSDKRVSWTEDTVDNEGKGRFRSNCCCIYVKPYNFDAPDDDEDDEECNDCKGHKKPPPKQKSTKASHQGLSLDDLPKPHRPGDPTQRVPISRSLLGESQYTFDLNFSFDLPLFSTKRWDLAPGDPPAVHQDRLPGKSNEPGLCFALQTLLQLPRWPGSVPIGHFKGRDNIGASNLLGIRAHCDEAPRTPAWSIRGTRGRHGTTGTPVQTLPLEKSNTKDQSSRNDSIIRTQKNYYSELDISAEPNKIKWNGAGWSGVTGVERSGAVMGLERSGVEPQLERSGAGKIEPLHITGENTFEFIPKSILPPSNSLISGCGNGDCGTTHFRLHPFDEYLNRASQMLQTKSGERAESSVSAEFFLLLFLLLLSSSWGACDCSPSTGEAVSTVYQETLAGAESTGGAENDEGFRGRFTGCRFEP